MGTKKISKHQNSFFVSGKRILSHSFLIGVIQPHANFAFVNPQVCATTPRYCLLLPPAYKVIYSCLDSSEIGLYATVTSYMVSAWYKNNLCMHGRIHTRYMTLQWRIMTILNAGLPLSNKIMYDFRKRPGGPSGELLWFITDRDITSTLGQGDKTAMLAAPAQSPALQSKASMINRRPCESAVPNIPCVNCCFRA